MSALPLLLAAVLAPAHALEKDFPARLYVPFLEPGLAANAPAGEAFAFDSIEWLSPKRGALKARMWNKKALVVFDASEDKKSATVAGVDLGDTPKPGSGEDVWRQRHGYQKRGEAYTWMTLADVPEALDAQTASAYDQVDKALWSLWARRALPEILAGKAPSAPAEGAELIKNYRLRYDKTGLVGESPNELQIRLWGMPVKVRFALKRAEPTHHNPWIITLAGPVQTTFDASVWRERHGYKRGALGGPYSWDRDFPDEKPSAEAFGKKMDELMARSAAYWADVSVHVVLQTLDDALKAEIGWDPSVLEKNEALEHLERAAESGDLAR